jgi:integrase
MPRKVPEPRPPTTKDDWIAACEAELIRLRPHLATYGGKVLTAGENSWHLAEQLCHVDVQMVFRVHGKFIKADFQKPKMPALRAVN